MINYIFDRPADFPNNLSEDLIRLLEKYLEETEIAEEWYEIPKENKENQCPTKK